MHDALAFSSLFIGEGATMASEAVVLGTPSIYVNSLILGYIEEEKDSGLLYSFRNSKGVIEAAKEIFSRDRAIKNKSLFLRDKIDVTKFLVWFFENYPYSKEIMQKQPNYQERFNF